VKFGTQTCLQKNGQISEMAGKSSRNKGLGGERELVNILKDQLGDVVQEIKRNLNQTRDAGADIIIQNYVIEVKRQENISIMKWFKQAEDSCSAGQIPIVAFRKNGGKWLVALALEDWIPHMRELLSQKSQSD